MLSFDAPEGAYSFDVTCLSVLGTLAFRVSVCKSTSLQEFLEPVARAGSHKKQRETNRHVQKDTDKAVFS